LLPRISARDPRYQVKNDPPSGIANLRILVTLETPGFVIHYDGAQIGREIAELIKEHLAEGYRRGRAPNGASLRRLKQETVARRRRRAAQKEDDSGAKADRYKVRGGGAYDSIDPTTPFHESGLIADNLQVRFYGTKTGDPVFVVAWPSGGKRRGLVNDDGRGARLFAVEHYGAEQMADVPRSAEDEIEKRLEVYLDDVLRAGGRLLGSLGRIGRSLSEFAQAAAGITEIDEDGR